MQDELDAGNGKSIYEDYIRVINNYLIPFFGKYDVANVNVKLLKEYEAWRDERWVEQKREAPIILKGKTAAQEEEILKKPLKHLAQRKHHQHT